MHVTTSINIYDIYRSRRNESIFVGIEPHHLKSLILTFEMIPRWFILAQHL